MFKFTASARTFASIALIVGAFLFWTDNSSAGWFVVLLGFAAFVISILARKL